MSNQDDGRNAWVADEGEAPFEPGRAGNAKSAIYDYFAKHHRTMERVTWIYVTLCVWLAVFAWVRFDYAEDTKSMIFYSMLLMLALFVNILMRLWYWILNNKYHILREIKLLRLETALRGPETGTVPADTLRDQPRLGLSRRERCTWLLFDIPVVIAIVLWASPLFPPDQVVRTHAVLSEHQATLVTKMTTQNKSGLPLTTIEQNCSLATTGPSATWIDLSSPALAEPPVFTTAFLDEHGNTLPYTIDAQPQSPPTPCRYQYHFQITPRTPVWPGDKWTLQERSEMKENPLSLFREGDVWNYRISACYGGRTEYRLTAVLPPGAQLVSVEPKPKRQAVCGLPCAGGSASATYVEFEESRSHNQPFVGLIKYRLAATAEAAPAVAAK